MCHWNGLQFVNPKMTFRSKRLRSSSPVAIPTWTHFSRSRSAKPGSTSCMPGKHHFLSVSSLKMGQTRHRFVYFITQLLKHRQRAWDLNMGWKDGGADKSTELWRHPVFVFFFVPDRPITYYNLQFFNAGSSYLSSRGDVFLKIRVGCFV